MTPGTVTITATTEDGGFKAQCAVKILPIMVSNIALAPAAKELDINEMLALTATVAPANTTNKNMKWSSDKPSVAEVSASGVVRGIGSGTATITVEAIDGSKLKAACKITVKSILVGSVAVSPASLEIIAGNAATLSAGVTPGNAANMKPQIPAN